MNKSSFFIIGQHAVIEALRNPKRRVLKVFLFKEKKSYNSYKEAIQFQAENRFNIKYQKMSSSQKEFKKELYSVDTDEQLIEKEEDIIKS